MRGGEFRTLVGASGCGKSTILRVIAGLEPQNSGTVEIGGRRVDQPRPKQRNVAMVFQSYALYPHMTVAENMAMPLLMQRLALAERLTLVGRFSPNRPRVMREIAAEVDAVARQLQIEALLTRKPAQLSGGQRQRVALGRSMVRHPDVFLMDEPQRPILAKFTPVQLADTHQSASRPFFQFNFDRVVEAMADIAPDHIVISGDLGLNGPDDIDNVAFAARQFDRLGAPWSAVPGNHDVGLHPFEGGLHQPIDEARHAAYLGMMGADRFVKDIGDWRLIGINSQLLNSGLAGEAEQHHWLTATLAETDRPVALFLHYPVFLDDPADTARSHAVLLPEAGAALPAQIDASSNVRLVASGHLHEDRLAERSSVVYRWALATSFMSRGEGHGGEPCVGFLVHCFDGATFTTERMAARWMIAHDITSWGETEPHGYYEIVKRPYPHVS